MKKILQRICVIILGSFLTIQIIPNDVKANEVKSNNYWTEKKFEDYTYYNHSIEDYKAVFDKIASIYNETKDENQIKDLIIQYSNMMDETRDDMLLARIEYEADMLNKVLFERYNSYITLYDEANLLLYSLEDEDMQEDLKEEIELSKAVQNYNEKLADLYTTEVDGKELNENEIYDLYDSGKKTYEECEQYLYKIEEKQKQVIGQAFVDIINGRNSYAKALGYKDYSEYIYATEKDYSLEEVDSCIDKVYEDILPVFLELIEHADRSSISKVKYSMDNKQLLEVATTSVKKISGDLAEPMDYMLRNNLYKISEAKNGNVLYGGSVQGFYKKRSLILSLKTQKTFSDYIFLTHELGHYEHDYFIRDKKYSGIAYTEFFSTAMNFMASSNMKGLISEKELVKLDNDIIFENLRLMLEGATCYKFERSIYKEENITVDRIAELFYDSYHKYLRQDTADKKLWNWVYKNYAVDIPFYHEEYTIACLASTQLWMEYLDNKETATNKLLKLLHADEGLDYYGVLNQAQLKNPFEMTNFQEIGLFLKGSFHYDPMLKEEEPKPDIVGVKNVAISETVLKKSDALPRTGDKTELPIVILCLSGFNLVAILVFYLIENKIKHKKTKQ